MNEEIYYEFKTKTRPLAIHKYKIISKEEKESENFPSRVVGVSAESPAFDFAEINATQETPQVKIDEISVEEVIPGKDEPFISIIDAAPYNAFEDAHSNSIESAVSAEEDSIEAAPLEDNTKQDENIKKARKDKLQKNLKKPKLSIFESYMTEEDRLKEELSNIINSDGYYDPILPEDYDEEYIHKEKKEIKPILVIALAITVIFAFYLIISNILALL